MVFYKHINCVGKKDIIILLKKISAKSYLVKSVKNNDEFIARDREIYNLTKEEKKAFKSIL